MLILELWALTVLWSLAVGLLMDECDSSDVPFYVLAAPLVCAFFVAGVAEAILGLTKEQE